MISHLNSPKNWQVHNIPRLIQSKKNKKCQNVLYKCKIKTSNNKSQ